MIPNTTQQTISRKLIHIGILFVVLNTIFIIARAVTDAVVYGIFSTLLITTFALYHGAKLYRLKGILLLLAVTLVVSWCYETLSINTGIPFGSYYYTEALKPRIGPVPVIIMPAYFAMGYLAWGIALILLDKRSGSIKGDEVILIPLLASFVMVMWDVCMDPFDSTISKLWIWHDGGVYFGVPLLNFLGWFICVFTFYLLFALIVRSRNKHTPPNIISNKPFWLLLVLMTISTSLDFLGNFYFRDNVAVTAPNGQVWQTQDINGSLALITVFTIIFISLYSIIRIYRNQTVHE